MAKFLDTAGLAYFYELLKTKFSTATVAAAKKIETPVLINGVSFDGSKEFTNIGKGFFENGVINVELDDFTLTTSAHFFVQLYSEIITNCLYMNVNGTGQYRVYKFWPTEQNQYFTLRRYGLYEFVYLSGVGYKIVQAEAPEMIGATASAVGRPGVVPVPAAGENTNFLRGDGTWANISDVVSITTGNLQGDQDTYEAIIPLPSGYTREQCRYAVWPRSVASDNTVIRLTVDQSTGLVQCYCFLDGQQTPGQIQYLCIAIK